MKLYSYMRQCHDIFLNDHNDVYRARYSVFDGLMEAPGGLDKVLVAYRTVMVSMNERFQLPATKYF